MKRILGIAMVLGLVGALTVMAQEVKPGKGEVKGKSGKARVKANPGKIAVVDLGKDVKLEMVLIPAGKFMMGSKKNPVDPFSNIKVEQPPEDELPQHEVTLTKSFYLGKYEVTQEQWFEIMGENPSKTKGRKLPVSDVSWNQCQDFIKKLNAKTNGGYRLPTEAEWEYACRAGTSTAYSFGEELSRSDANLWDDANKKESYFAKPVEVGSYKPNAFGLYDMHGNVSEWCEDWYGDYPAGKVTDPKGPAKGNCRVTRGGSYRTNLKWVHCSSRLGGGRTVASNTGFLDGDTGFRLVRVEVLGLIGVMAQQVKPGKVDVVDLQPAKPHVRKTYPEVKNVKCDAVDLGEDVKLEMVLVPAGKFEMGFTKKELADLKVEIQEDFKKAIKKELAQKELDLVGLGMSHQGKQHEVTLTKSFYMGKYEVTQEQWVEIMGEGNNPSGTKGAELPVTRVTWEDCQEFIKKLNAKTNGGYRLPTEAEWEYACRAGTTTKYSYGDSLTKSDANINGESTKAVGSYKPNAFGLYDMHGNVSEWCEDWHGDYPAESVTDPKGPPDGYRHVWRGGSFDDFESAARSSYRHLDVVVSYQDLGFRLVRARAEAKEVQKEATKRLQKGVEAKADLEKCVKLEMVLIPAGKFKMGYPGDEHEVTLTKPFYMGKYEVTQEQWEAVMGKGNISRSIKGAKLPVTEVTWEDCQDFIKKLNAKTNGSFRLPTEAEWEYACRAGTSTAYSFGEELSRRDANIWPFDKIKEIGSYRPNAFGLYDMHGNVWEWCEDWYGDYPAEKVTDPKGPAKGNCRVTRGGSFHWKESYASSFSRESATESQDERKDDVGFRLAKD